MSGITSSSSPVCSVLRFCVGRDMLVRVMLILERIRVMGEQREADCRERSRERKDKVTKDSRQREPKGESEESRVGVVVANRLAALYAFSASRRTKGEAQRVHN